MGSEELTVHLQALVSEINRLLFVGENGRQRRGIRSLSVETLRYVRAGAAQVAAGQAGPETLRELVTSVAPGCAPDAPLLALVRAVEAAL